MEFYFNELSLNQTDDSEKAKTWFKELALTGRLLKQIVESFDGNRFVFRRSENFGTCNVTESLNVIEFIQFEYGFSDPISIFLLGIFDSPYIDSDDPDCSAYEYTNLVYEDNEYSATGLAAAYLKDSIALSLNTNEKWNNCNLNITVRRFDENNTEIVENQTVRHISVKNHIKDCHLPYLADKLFDFEHHKPRFDFNTRTQTILPLKEIYGLYLGFETENKWAEFYRNLARMEQNERVAKIREIARMIASVQKWGEVTGNLKNRNEDRELFYIPNSEFIASIDIRHGDFEILKHQNPPNHYGSISFDGSRFKPASNDHSINV